MFEDVFDGAKARLRRRDQNSHIARQVLVIEHLLVRGGDFREGEDLRHARVDAPVDDELVGGRRLGEVGKVRTLHALLAHPQEAGIHGQVEAGGAGTDDDHAAAFHHEDRDREGAFAGMLEHDVDILLAGDLPDRLSELAALAHIVAEFRAVHLRQLSPAIEVLAVEHALGAH